MNFNLAHRLKFTFILKGERALVWEHINIDRTRIFLPSLFYMEALIQVLFLNVSSGGSHLAGFSDASSPCLAYAVLQFCSLGNAFRIMRFRRSRLDP